MGKNWHHMSHTTTIQTFVNHEKYLCMHNVKKLRELSTSSLRTTQYYYNRIMALKAAFDTWICNKNICYFEGTFLPISLVKCLPQLKCKPYFIGGTYYIDGIGIQDIRHSISIGVDVFRRPFITLAYREDVSKKAHCLTVFQRYTDNKHMWVKSDENYTGVILSNTSTCLDAENKELFIDNIICLILGRPIVHKVYNECDAECMFQKKSSCRLLFL